MTRLLKVVGLTGGIASGKSAVAAVLRQRGLPVLDADELGHMVLEPQGEACDEVVAVFGREVLGGDGAIDRQKLGAKVFGDVEARARLEAITHPAIARLAQRALSLVAESGHKLAIYEAALLVETGVYKGLDALVVVSCSVETQARRVMARDGLCVSDAAARIASQLPLSEKLKVADYIIENEGDLAALRDKALSLVPVLVERFGGDP
ncbi:MAG: dephospho-CoA kinase [Myxococcota bacterium]|jgi:dephospho-CoA kinase|nr:dephospho-CoA kinase [Myxococcota bacterium]